ncbi:hypothetical protein D7B24_007335 [Verticillium nonalfalfae]|uniref:NmrA-like domain-containing protein n=1 Tax=Verticillium nonalfalfae TaxID=1051616 RepID=A0A3M9Y9D2_9PEZI|nr:uncharacterized protein D7B24_007335 [Verticillium nonalfalfae]RNJ56386.1 hypothetical protein D7B24_007335 [Verticillium nonalfalfae]
MSQQIKNVVIAGATGSAGSHVLQALVKSGKFNVTAAVRKANDKLPSSVNVKVIDFDSADALVETFKGQDAVIDTTMSPDSAMPLRMVEAAVAAGVSRFIPSEFSIDPRNSKGRSVPVYAPKNEVLAKLEELAAAGKLTWTSISNGAFLDWNLRTGFFKIHLKAKKAELLNGGEVVTAWTLLDHIGQAAVGVLLHPEETKNRPVYISTIQMSQKKMVELAQQALGRDGWDVSSLDMEPVYQQSLGELFAGRVTFEVIGNLILYCNSREDYSGPFVKTDNALLGVEQWSDEQVKQLIVSIASE